MMVGEVGHQILREHSVDAPAHLAITGELDGVFIKDRHCEFVSRRRARWCSRPGYPRQSAVKKNVLGS